MADTNIAQEISRITTARNTIRNKIVNLFGNNYTSADITALASVIDGIVNQGAVSAQVQEGQTYTIPAGYHNGSGVVAGASGGGNYELQTKNVTPTKAQQNITPDDGKYGLSAVLVEAIPAAYQDVTSVTAEASQVLATKIFVNANGSIVTGTMVNNGAVNQTISVASPSYTVPSGYHSGAGVVSIIAEESSAIPSTSSQEVVPTSGKVLSKVTVEAIPSNFADVTNVDATAADVLSGKTIVLANGSEVEGTMADNSAVSVTLDTSTTNYTVPTGYHNGAGIVGIVLEVKDAVPSASSQNVVPSSGKVLSKVTVAAIPTNWGDTTDDDGIAENVLNGIKVHTNVAGAASQITGSMTNNGTISGTINGLTVTSYAIPSGYVSGGSVALTSDIENALAAI